MDLPIIGTKLNRPRVKSALVCRQRLHERLDRAVEGPLTLVSAPAGYGKSVLVSHWLDSRPEPHGWLSLDPSDSDLNIFLGYFVAALRTAFPDACPDTWGHLRAPKLPPAADLAGCLVNEIDALDSPLVLILDDYERIDGSSVHDFLGRVLEHPPSGLELVIATRRDPPLPLPAMLARGQLTEVRLRDLEFTKDETAQLLEVQTGVGVSERALGNLKERLEGWAAGLYLVSLTLRHRADPDAFLEGLSGGLSQVQDYLLQEVLVRQTPAMQDWLRKTSILDRFCASLCDAVCGSDREPAAPALDGREFMRAIDTGNLFCIALDQRGEWSRYHYLFQDLIRRQLVRGSSKAEVAGLHLRASEWFESRGLVTESLEHALAAGGFERAADIVERHRYAEMSADRWFVVERWLADLPAEIKRRRPGLLLAQAWIAFYRFELPKLVPLVEQVETLLGDEHQESGLSGELDFFRGNLLYWQGDGPGSVRLLEHAKLGLPERGGVVEGNLEVMLGLARSMIGRGEKAVRELTERIRKLDPADGVFLAHLLAAVSLVDLVSGNLVQVHEHANQFLIAAKANKLNNNVSSWSSYLLGCACLHTHDLDQAVRSFEQAVPRRYLMELRAAIDALAGLALARQLDQQQEQAAEAVRLLIGFTREMNDPECTSLAQSCRARISLLRGDLMPAVRWARSLDEVPLPSSLVMWLEVPVITQARVMVAFGSEECLAKATELLRAIREQSESLHFTAQTIEVVVLQALLLDKQGREDEALEALDQALALGGPRGWIRPYVEAGRPMADLLKRALKRGIGPDYLGEILAACGTHPSRQTAEAPRLVEALTNREEEILELLDLRLQDKEIAGKLFISRDTVKYHLRHIYQKLGVGDRRGAVARARDLGLLIRD